jgi:phytoene desaturase
MAEARRVAVVGSGFGGLAAAVRLQAAGLAVTVFEARDRPGGCAAVHEQDGFVFDGGPTVITAPSCLDELFALAGKSLADRVTLLPVRPFYRLRFADGEELDYGDEESMLAWIRAHAPADLAGYRRFADFSRRTFERGYQRWVAARFDRLRDAARALPDLARLRADRSVHSAVSRCVRDERLRQALGFHTLLVGGSPFETPSIYALIHHLERREGVWFVRGGTGALVRALLELLRDLGGELRLGTPVERVRVRTGAAPRHLVSSPGARDEPFHAVVSNADVHQTYASLYREVPGAAPARRRLDRMHWSMSLFVLHFGTRRRFPGVAHHTVLFGPRYEGLLREIFHGSALPADMSLYLHAPGASDESLAPPGCDGFYALAPVPNLRRAALDWDALAPAYADRVLDALEPVLPGVRGDIVTRRVQTPLDFARDLRTRHGAAFSVAPRLSQSAWFRPPNRDRRIPGLYLVGAGTHPGAGVPGVVNGAKATARAVLEDLAC